MRALQIGASCLWLAACASAHQNAAMQRRVVPPREEQQPQPPPALDASAPEAPPSEPVPLGPGKCPLDDPHTAQRYGYPPGTILRFSTAGPLPHRRRVIADIKPRFKEAPTPLRLLVFRSCADDGSCRDEVAVRERGASPFSLTPIPSFAPTTGLIEAAEYAEGAFKLYVERGSEHFLFYVGSERPYPTTVRAVPADSQWPRCFRGSPGD
jgi:hypothetical protein